MCCTLTSHGKWYEFGAEKSISCAKPAHFDTFTINFIVWSHILSIVVLELTTDPPTPGMGACTNTNHIRTSVQVTGRPTISLL